MRTVEVKIYKFEELSEEAKERAINAHRDINDNCYNEYEATLKAFEKVFPHPDKGVDEDVLSMSVNRLRTWVINNFWDEIHKGKYYSLWSKEQPKDNTYGVLKARYSRIIWERSCPLTGMVFDMDVLEHVYKFLDNDPNLKDYYSEVNYDYSVLYYDCIQSLESTYDKHSEHQRSDVMVADTLVANEYEFTESGELF